MEENTRRNRKQKGAQSKVERKKSVFQTLISQNGENMAAESNRREKKEENLPIMAR